MKQLILIPILFILISNRSYAAPETGPKYDASDALSDASKTLIIDENFWLIAANYSYFDLWLPGKFGAIVAYGTKERVFELGYQVASYNFNVIVTDLGEITDERIHLTTRSFSNRNSFNYQYGLSLNTTSARLGRQWYGDLGPRYDAISVSTLNVVWGIGNRWKWENGITLGLDWIKFFYPIAIMSSDTAILNVIENESRRDDIKGFVNAISQIPTLAILQIEIGYQF